MSNKDFKFDKAVFDLDTKVSLCVTLLLVYVALTNVDVFAVGFTQCLTVEYVLSSLRGMFIL